LWKCEYRRKQRGVHELRCAHAAGPAVEAVEIAAARPVAGL
jgi:hypothetical protein